MAFERKDNSGAIFANDRKEKDSHPDRRGDCMIEGVEYWISGWVKQDKNGKPFMSVSFKRKDATQDKSSAPVKPRAARPMTLSETLDDEVPF